MSKILDTKRPKYEGSIFGFNYSIDFDTDEEFVEWLVTTIKRMNPLLPKILDALLNESADFTALKESSI